MQLSYRPNSAQPGGRQFLSVQTALELELVPKVRSRAFLGNFVKRIGRFAGLSTKFSTRFLRCPVLGLALLKGRASRPAAQIELRSSVWFGDTFFTKSRQRRSKYHAEMALFRCWHCRCFTVSRTRRTPFARRRVKTRLGKSGDGFTAERWFRRRREPLNQIDMTVYQKQQLPVQFLQFGVDSVRITVPILRSDKANFLRLRPAIRPANPPVESAPSSR